MKKMSNMWNAEQTALYLANHNNYLILTHDNPDGDTLGSGFALCYALRQAGKNANVIYEELPEKLRFLADEYEQQFFTPTAFIAVDMASESMFGENTKAYLEKVDLCIDHHGSNTMYAKNLYLDSRAAANCENIYNVIDNMGVKINSLIATCLYTGIATDTGCFKFSNVTPNTHIYAGTLMSYGVDIAKINFSIFEQKSKAYLDTQSMVLDTLEYYADGKIAVCSVTRDILSKTGLMESDLDAIVAIPRSIVGVEIGVTLKERDDGFKVSLRTSENVDASAVAAQFGGGGHIRAAGCFIKAPIDEAKRKIVSACTGAVENL